MEEKHIRIGQKEDLFRAPFGFAIRQFTEVVFDASSEQIELQSVERNGFISST